jgi:hypothetical protein
MRDRAIRLDPQSLNSDVAAHLSMLHFVEGTDAGEVPLRVTGV